MMVRNDCGSIGSSCTRNIKEDECNSNKDGRSDGEQGDAHSKDQNVDDEMMVLMIAGLDYSWEADQRLGGCQG